MSGHSHSISHRYSNTLSSYLQLLYLYPNEQLALFLISNYFVFMSLQSHTSLKTDCYLKGISLYSHFIQLRLQYLSKILSSFSKNNNINLKIDNDNNDNNDNTKSFFDISIENDPEFIKLDKEKQVKLLFINVNVVIEIYYNLCLLLYSIKLNHLCADYLYKILELSNKYKEKNVKCLLIEESAYLLIHILRESNNESKALEIMIEYLNYD